MSSDPLVYEQWLWDGDFSRRKCVVFDLEDSLDKLYQLASSTSKHWISAVDGGKVPLSALQALAYQRAWEAPVATGLDGPRGVLYATDNDWNAGGRRGFRRSCLTCCSAGLPPHCVV